jgi:hypothetical protein
MTALALIAWAVLAQPRATGLPLEVHNDDRRAIDQGLSLGLLRDPVPAKDDLDRDAVREVFGNPAIDGCYVKALAADPKLKGRVTVRALVDDAGKVVRAELYDPDEVPSALRGKVQPKRRAPDPEDLHDEKMIACVLDAIRALKFPARTKGRATLVRYGFFFRTD